MIEKVPFETEKITHNGKTMEIDTHASPYDLQHKINELVDAVNEFEKDREEIKEWIAIVSNLRSRVPVVESRVSILEEHAHPTATTEPTDPYAEQRKWIGKLCKFWDYDGEEKWFSILEHIDKNSPYTYCASGDWWYKHCELVKPDDDIIYRGE